MKRFGLGIAISAVIGFFTFAGCSVETQASDVICVPDQSNLCTDCPTPSDATDGQSYAGRHVCAHDGKSFGACTQCVPSVNGSALTEVSHPGNDGPDGKPVVAPTGATIDAVCAGKLGVIAGKDDPDNQFTYPAVYNGTEFKVFSTSGAPMRSRASSSLNGNGVMTVYRSKNDALVMTTFANGVWSPATSVGATTDGAPSMALWGTDLKAVFRQSDGYHHVATFTNGSWADGVELVGDSTADPLLGLSEPSAVSTGAPGLAGSALMVGYADGEGGLYRQEWRGDGWLSQGIRATSIDAGGFRPEIISMTSGDFDLVSTYITSDGLLHASTRASKDRGSVWSPDSVTNAAAQPLEAPAGLGLSGGRALVVFLDSEGRGQFMIFDPSQTPSWSAPRPLQDTQNPVLASTPTLIPDPCGAEAALAYATDSGVALMRYQGDSWRGPFAVDGIPGATYANVVGAP